MPDDTHPVEPDHDPDEVGSYSLSVSRNNALIEALEQAIVKVFPQEQTLAPEAPPDGDHDPDEETTALHAELQRLKRVLIAGEADVVYAPDSRDPHRPPAAPRP